MTEYKRVQGKSFMICKAEDICTGYEIQMLQKNKIMGLIPVQIEEESKGMSFWYEISGKNDLESYVRVHKIDGRFLVIFFKALQQTIENVGAYLLDDKGISLDPCRIFLDFEEKEISFCYVPFEKKNFEESLREFMEYFLQHMEHSNQEDLHKCYKVYEYCQKENVFLEELIQMLIKGERVQDEEQFLLEEEELKEEKIVKGTTETLKWKNRKSLFGKRKKKEEEPFAYEPEEIEEEETHPTVFLGSEMKEILGELRYEGNGAQKNMKILTPVYLIGKDAKEVDGVISASTVSRIHAKIMKEGEGYYLEDMNSTNGTYKNGCILNYKERVLLDKNDVVKFAEESYRFV